MTEYVDTFMMRKAPEIDSSWQISAMNKFDENRRQKQASKRVRERTNSFWSVVTAFQDHTKRDDLKRFRIDGQHRWDDVKTMASDAVEKDAEKTKWRKNPFRAAGRSLQRSACNLEVLLSFLPNDGLVGILCGALTFIFSAAKRLDEVRTRILYCLDSLPEIVERTENYVDIYDEDPQVWNAAENLYIGILDGVEGMLQWIDKSAFERAFKVLALPATFGASLEEDTIKKNIEDKVVRFREVMQVNLHRRVGQQYKTIQTLQTQLNSLLAHSQWTVDNPQAVVLFKSYINLDELRATIGVDPQMVRKDMHTALIDAQNVCPPKLVNHALGILHNERFVMWLQSNMSQMLFINGRMQLNTEQEATSPFTILSCVLAQSITKQLERNLSLLHLCGQHSSPNDTYGGPIGIIRCLNSQLAHALAQEDVNLSGIDYKFVDGIKERNADVLRYLFRLLLSAATGRVVFVLVDGISWMEEGPQAHEFGDFVVFFRNLLNEMNNRQPGLILKVLLTNPSTSLHVHRWLPNASILELEDVEDSIVVPGEADILW
ncbi:hypothetical protein CKAH01_07314 [Colletotrichum kahawae]|uniref:Uncharacterized protein n=1 Tax=Colletotrichum kahawae TaxID=34407 RepID=A0AAD9Y621_COLKA|nr:hypothetical protein CKAH01_07314 [Colletotrichum kahawae]